MTRTKFRMTLADYEEALEKAENEIAELSPGSEAKKEAMDRRTYYRRRIRLLESEKVIEELKRERGLFRDEVRKLTPKNKALEDENRKLRNELKLGQAHVQEHAKLRNAAEASLEKAKQELAAAERALAAEREESARIGRLIKREHMDRKLAQDNERLWRWGAICLFGAGVVAAWVFHWAT